MRKLDVLLIIAIVFLASCKPKTEDLDSQNADGSESSIDVGNLKFSSDVAYQAISKQVSFGSRVPSTPAHEECAHWLLTELKLVSDTSYFQEFEAVTYDGKKHKGKNILAKINPNNPNRIQLAAHWDTRPIADQDSSNKAQPILGADDAGSGVGVILALLQVLKEKKVTLGVDVVFFDIEDYGQPQNSGLLPMEHSWCLGSQYWGKNYRESNRPRWGVLLDMVGSKSASFHKEEISMLYASNLVNRIWNISSNLGCGQLFKESAMGTIEDDHMYMNTLAAIPTVDIINYRAEKNSFGEHWHTHKDNMDIIDKNTLKCVGQALEQLILEEDKIIQ